MRKYLVTKYPDNEQLGWFDNVYEAEFVALKDARKALKGYIPHVREWTREYSFGITVLIVPNKSVGYHIVPKYMMAAI